MPTPFSKEEATAFFAELFYGEHHLDSPVKEYGPGFYVTTHKDLASTDFNNLTRLVLMAHRDAIRVSINPHNSNLIKICIWKREKDNPDLVLGHPTIEQAIEKFNSLKK